MIQHKFTMVCCVLLLLFAAHEPLRCGIPTMYSEAHEFPHGVTILQAETPQGFPYVSGGVSSDEREIIEELGKSYNLKLTFAEKRGSYLADVTVVITGTKGTEIIVVNTLGPFFYIRLPPGVYTITARFQGEIKRIKDLRLPKDKKVTRTITWDLGEQSEDLQPYLQP
ncbi:MAG TPA: carboxypeptidase-like regulatory domain-containing protein [Candidatus Binatia bacterium]